MSEQHGIYEYKGPAIPDGPQTIDGVELVSGDRVTQLVIDSIPAGRDLDALIAEKVMGWHQQYGYWKSSDNSQEYIVSYWRPSTDIAVAWQVVERIESRAMMLLLWRPNLMTGWYAVFQPEDGSAEGVTRIAETAPLAICRAALAATDAR